VQYEHEPAAATVRLACRFRHTRTFRLSRGKAGSQNWRISDSPTVQGIGRPATPHTSVLPFSLQLFRPIGRRNCTCMGGLRGKANKGGLNLKQCDIKKILIFVKSHFIREVWNNENAQKCSKCNNLIRMSYNVTVVVNSCAPRTHPTYFYMYSYEKACLELCEVFRKASFA
jgi:hypothetical protein